MCIFEEASKKKKKEKKQERGKKRDVSGKSRRSCRAGFSRARFPARAPLLERLPLQAVCPPLRGRGLLAQARAATLPRRGAQLPPHVCGVVAGVVGAGHGHIEAVEREASK